MSMKQKKGQKNKPIGKVKSKPFVGNKLNLQLAEIGLRIINVVADGNCLFRAIADQLEGNQEKHTKYRKMVVDHIQNHKEEFEPFVEDEVPFEEYCTNMRKEGTWAGHVELQAASLVTQSNICIHRLMSPRWQICNFEKKAFRCMHLSYHDGEHYNSVRKIDDNGIGPAKPIRLEGDDKNMETPSLKVKKSHSDNVYRGASSTKDSLKLLEKTGLMDDDVGDTRVGTECLGFEDSIINDNTLSRSQETNDLMNYDASDDNHQEGKVQKFDLNGHGSSSKNGDIHDGLLQTRKSNLPAGPQKVARNKACSCGSRKKYKACCGVARKNSTAQVLTSSSKSLTNKERKEKARNVTGQIETTSASHILGLGSICI